MGSLFKDDNIDIDRIRRMCRVYHSASLAAAGSGCSINAISRKVKEYSKTDPKIFFRMHKEVWVNR